MPDPTVPWQPPTGPLHPETVPDLIQPRDENLGQVIAGRYTLIKVLGQGGMGTVYLAEQTEPVRRQVALKLIRAGIDSRSYVTRFEAERQALAVMDHPNIARVYDGGTTQAHQPYFVMELVQGVPITQYCDEQRLSPKARLELFVLICHAVQHAHQKGIIHRDLKPGNVLVTLVDGKPVPKVIDFGLAKATEQPLTDETIEEQGAVGTPAYMSPEQADPENNDVDTRTDIYALGVILYELLTGTTPIDIKQFRRGALLEMLRMVREVDPPKPSTRLSSAEALPSIAANRDVEPRQLLAMVRGDFDWIVMKALEKDRSRRYETANGFAADVLRYLRGEPVQAHPPNRWYRIRKFIRRNRVQVVTAGFVIAALVAGLIGSLWQMNRALTAEDSAKKNELQAKQERDEKETQRRLAADREKQARFERDEKEKERKYAQAIADFVMFDFLALTSVEGQERFDQNRSKLSRNTTLQELLDRASAKLDSRSDLDPRTVADLSWMIGISYEGFGEAEQAVKHLERCAEIRKRIFGPDDPKTLHALNSLAIGLLQAGKMKNSISFLERACEIQQKTLGPKHPNTLNLLNTLAYAYIDSKRLSEAIAIYERILPIEEELHGLDHQDTIIASMNLAIAYMDVWMLPKAISLYERALESCIKLKGETHTNSLTLFNNVSLAYELDRNMSRAIAVMEKMLKAKKDKFEQGTNKTIGTQLRLADLLCTIGNQTRALLLINEALEQIDQHQLIEKLTRYQVHRASICLEKMNQLQKSNDWLTRWMKVVARKYGVESLEYALELEWLGRNLILQGRWPDAEKLLRESCIIYARKSRDSWNRFHAMSLLGKSLLEQKKFSDAEPLLIQACQGLQKFVPQRFHADTPSYVKDYETMHEALALALDYLIQYYTVTKQPAEIEKWKKGASDLDLSSLSWAFKYDQESNSNRELWLCQPLDESWRTLRIGLFWDKQGYSFNQGSVWYRIAVDIPKNWLAGTYYLNTTGVDDAAEFYLNGKPIGTMGNQAYGRSAFAMPESISMTGCQPGQKVQIAVRVFNTGGLGGIHRSIILSQTPQNLKEMYMQLLNEHELRLNHELKQPEPNEANLFSFRDNIAVAWEKLEQPSRAEMFLRNNVDSVKSKKVREIYPGVALAAMAENLAIQSKWTEAEQCLRTALTAQLTTQPSAWTTSFCKSRLGYMLMRQKKYIEAESLLIQSNQALNAMHHAIPQAFLHLTTSVDSLILLYSETGKPEEVKKWKAEKSKLLAMTP